MHRVVVESRYLSSGVLQCLEAGAGLGCSSVYRLSECPDAPTSSRPRGKVGAHQKQSATATFFTVK
jgi:hypothetical protein